MRLAFRSSHRLFALLGAVVLCAALAACNSSSEVPETEETATPFQVHAIFNPNADAAAQVSAALAQAAQQHKRVILDFGGNWCGDCQILDYYFHQPPNAALIARNYILVDIDAGHLDKNLDIAHKYGLPLAHGVPALAVLDPSGHVLYSQRNGEFSAMGRVDPAAVTQFLEQWKG